MELNHIEERTKARGMSETTENMSLQILVKGTEEKNW